MRETTQAELGPCPDRFPHKGEYPRYSASWQQLDEYASTPAYAGQQPVRFPLWRPPFECFNGFGRLTDPEQCED